MNSNKETSSDGKNWIRISVRIGVAILLIALILAWQADVFTSQSKARPLKDARQVEAGAQIMEVQVTLRPSVRSLVGALQARHPVELAARISGRVMQVSVEDGAAIQQGQALLRLDREIPESRFDQAAAAVSKAESRLKGSEELLERIRQATKAKATPETRLVEARQMRDVAAAALTQAKAALAEAETQLSYTEVESPFDGVVIEVLADAGDQVRAGQPVALIYKPSELELVVAIPAGLLAKVKQADCLDVQLDALSETVPVTLRTIEPMADPASRTVTVHFSFDPPSGALPGMFARLQLPGKPSKTMILPKTAIQEIRQLAFVWVVTEENSAVRRIVRLGGSGGPDEVEVLAGLSPGERILRNPSEGLSRMMEIGTAEP